MIVALGPGGSEGIPLGALRMLGAGGRADVRATDDVIAAKVQAALRHKLIPVICVGETADDLRPFDPRAVARAIAGLSPE